MAGGTLTTGAVFDVDTRSSYTVRVQVTDAGGLSFERASHDHGHRRQRGPDRPDPHDSHVDENAPVPALVGTLASSDPDVGDGATYTLVAGAGSTDNASFQITGTNLDTAAVLDFETKASYDIRVRVTDTRGLSSEATFAIQVDDVNDGPLAGDDTFTGAIGNTKATAGTVTTTGPKVALTGNLPLRERHRPGPGQRPHHRRGHLRDQPRRFGHHRGRRQLRLPAEGRRQVAVGPLRLHRPRRRPQ